MERAVRRRAGLVVGVRRGDDTSVVGRAHDGPHPDGRTLFEIGSITKTFTSLLLADGVVRGEWSLDDPVRALLPPGTVVPTRDGAEITLAHLATHTSGLPNAPVPLLRGSVEMLRGRDPYARLTPDGLLAALAGATLARTPGTGGVHYSNLGVGVLGQALAHAAGTSYAALVEQRVCRPARPRRHRHPRPADRRAAGPARAGAPRPAQAGGPLAPRRAARGRRAALDGGRPAPLPGGPARARHDAAGRRRPAHPAAPRRGPAAHRAGVAAQRRARPALVAQRRHRWLPLLRRLRPHAAYGRGGAEQPRPQRGPAGPPDAPARDGRPR